MFNIFKKRKEHKLEQQYLANQIKEFIFLTDRNCLDCTKSENTHHLTDRISFSNGQMDKQLHVVFEVKYYGRINHYYHTGNKNMFFNGKCLSNQKLVNDVINTMKIIWETEGEEFVTI